MKLHGILVINKEQGWTSHDVVARVRRITGERKVGHTGTLDPAATGVLPVCLGAATKVIEYLQDATKSYYAEVVLGIETDTDDLEGRIVREAPVPALGVGELEAALAPFRGPLEQVPPMYAAIKVGGRKLYELARAGETVERAPRAVRIATLALLGWDRPVARLLVDCSKGTYIRALARDLGRALGCGAHLHRLVRLRTGPFFLDQALTLAQLEEEFDLVPWPELALHPDAALLDWPAIVLDEAGALAWRQGKPMAVGAATTADRDPAPFAAAQGRSGGGRAGGVEPDSGSERGPGSGRPGEPVERCRAYSTAGDWLGLGRYDAQGGVWRPEKVVIL